MYCVNKGAYKGLEFSEERAKAFYKSEGLETKKTATKKRFYYNRKSKN
jgi:hypothetical protein